MAEQGPIERQFAADDSDRHGSLASARMAAQLTKPWVLPPSGQNANDELPKNYQSVGSRGVGNLAGRLLLALYPPDLPWFLLVPASQIRNSSEIDPRIIQQIQQDLFLYGRMLIGKLESNDIDPVDDRGQFSGFRSTKRKVLEQLIITGDSLERLDESYRLTLFRRDQYVTKRDSSGAILYHIVRERKDPLELSEAQLTMSQLPAETLEMGVKDRMQNLYTKIEWQPLSKDWLIEQELGTHIINTSTETVSPYFSTAFELAGEDYGRGFVEQNLGDLRTLDELELRRIDLMALAAKMLIGVRRGSQVRDEDLRQGPGEVVRGLDIEGGQVQDVAMMNFVNVRDFSMLSQASAERKIDLGKAFLIESETTRRAERVTTQEIRRNVFEIESALGGVYASVADEQQTPLIRRVIHQFNKDEKIELPKAPGDNRSMVEIRSLTGLAALASQTEAEKLLQGLQIIQMLGPEALQNIDTRVAVDVILRQVGFHEPGLILSDEQIAQRQQQQAQQQLMLAGGQQAISSAGRIAEQAAQPPAPPRNVA